MAHVTSESERSEPEHCGRCYGTGFISYKCPICDGSGKAVRSAAPDAEKELARAHAVLDELGEPRLQMKLINTGQEPIPLANRIVSLALCPAAPDVGVDDMLNRIETMEWQRRAERAEAELERVARPVAPDAGGLADTVRLVKEHVDDD